MNDRQPPPDDDPVAEVDVNAIVRDVLEVAQVALGRDMQRATETEVRDLLDAALAVIERAMPHTLQAQDRRVVEARGLRRLLDMSSGRDP